MIQKIQTWCYITVEVEGKRPLVSKKSLLTQIACNFDDECGGPDCFCSDVGLCFCRTQKVEAKWYAIWGAKRRWFQELSIVFKY